MKKTKKILFIHPLGVNWIPGEQDMSRIANIMAPIGLLNLAAWIDKHGHTSAIHDCYAFPGQDDSIAEYLTNERPNFIGFSTTTSSFLDGVRIAARCKNLLPQAKTVFGGVHISALREDLLHSYPELDYGVVGEGEKPLLSLLESDGENLESIQGLIFRKNGSAVFNGVQKELMDMDELPFPAYQKLDGFPKSYQLPIFNYPKAPNATVITSRGCPYSCSYCDRSVFGRSYRFNSAQYMMDLFIYLRRHYGIKHVNIYDDNFTLIKKRVYEFCELKLKSGLKMTFNCAARAEQIDSELLKKMRHAGCWMISLGIETGDINLLKRHRSYLPKDNTERPLELIREKIQEIKKAGIRVKGLFMLGLPGETEESVDKSMEYVFSLPLDDFNLSKLTPFPGAPLYRDLSIHGDFEENWELMNALNFVFVPKAFTKGKLEERYREFYRRYFTRPKVLLSYVSMLWKSPHSWYRFLKDLKTFLSFRKGYKKKK